MKINECAHNNKVTALISNVNGDELSFETRVINEFSEEDIAFLDKVRTKLKEKSKDTEFCVVEPFFDADVVKKLMYTKDLVTGEVKKQRVTCSVTIIHSKRKTYIYEYVDVMKVNLTDGREVNLIVTADDIGPINRRDEYRLSMLYEADMRINHAGGIKVIKLKDLSVSGVGLTTDSDTKISLGDTITIDLYDVSFDKIKKANLETRYCLEFVVVRIVKIDDNTILVGAKTTRESQKQTMGRFINRKQLERSRG